MYISNQVIITTESEQSRVVTLSTKIKQEGPKGPRSLTWGKGQGEAIYRGPLMLSTKYW